MVKGTLVSIDIGVFQTVILVGKETNSKLNIKRVYMFPTPENSISNGQIINKAALVDTLGAKIREYKLQKMKAVITISSSVILVREFLLPHIKGNDLETMLQYEIEQYLPIILNDYVKQHKIIQYLEDASGEKQRVLLCAIPTSIVEEYHELLKEIHLIPHALDTHSNCVEKLFGEELLKRKDSILESVTKAYIDIGHDNISIIVMRSGMFRYERQITGGSSQISDVILGMGYDATEVEDIKRQNIIIDEASDDLLRNEILTSNVITIINQWLTEIQRNFSFYTSRTPGNKIDEIYVYGGGARLKGLDAYLAGYFRMPVTLIKSINKVKMNKNDAEFATNIVNAAGAIIRR